MTEQTFDNVNFQWTQSGCEKQASRLKKSKFGILSTGSKKREIFSKNSKIDDAILFERILELKAAVKKVEEEL